MKPAFLFLLFIAIVSRGYSQLIDYSHLSPDDKDIAVQAFSKVGTETKKWFAEAAKQHPAGVFDESWVRTKLKERFGQDEINKVGNLFLVMMAYQLILNREARRGRQISDNNKQLQLNEKNKKLNVGKEKIDEQKKEAEGKRDGAMNAAGNQLATGVTSGASQVGGAGDAKSGQSSKKIILMKPLKLDTSKQQKKNLNMNQQAQQADEADKKSKEDQKASEQHRKNVRDSIQKLLDLLSKMGKNVKM